jgi:hypothetical protein
MVPIHFTTGTSTPTWTQIGSFSEFCGVVASNAEAATYYIRITWKGNQNNAPTAGIAPTGPIFTIPISTTFVGLILQRTLVQLGPMYYMVSGAAGDADATALGTGGDVITLLVE